MDIEPGTYNVHSQRVVIRDDGTRVLQLAIARPGHRYTDSLPVVEAVLTPPPPTPEESDAENARHACLRVLYTKYGMGGHTATFIEGIEAEYGRGYWLEAYYHESSDGTVVFKRHWLVREYNRFIDGLQEGEL